MWTAISATSEDLVVTYTMHILCNLYPREVYSKWRRLSGNLQRGRVQRKAELLNPVKFQHWHSACIVCRIDQCLSRICHESQEQTKCRWNVRTAILHEADDNNDYSTHEYMAGKCIGHDVERRDRVEMTLEGHIIKCHIFSLYSKEHAFWKRPYFNMRCAAAWMVSTPPL